MKPKTSVKRSVVLSEKAMKQLEHISASKQITVSELIREYVDKGLTVDGYRQDKEFLGSIVREQMELIFSEARIKEMMNKQTERLAKMLMKNGKVAGGGFFLSLALLSYLESMTPDEIEMLYQRSIRLGVQYMQQPDSKVSEALLDLSNLSRIGL